MKLLDCRDVLPDCDMIFTGIDDDEVIGYVTNHLRRSHGVEAAVPELATTFRQYIVLTD